MEAYSVVITSCGRFDLLRATLASLLPMLDPAPAKILIVEDSCNPAVADAVAGLGSNFDFLVNESKLGQIASIDRAYSAVTTPYIFHCEDDWEFFRGGFLAESAILLERFPTISMVGLRPRSELNHRIRHTPAESAGDFSFFNYNPKLHPEYFSYAFNPGLRRLADYKAIGPFAPLGYEPDISYAFKKAGFHMAGLDNPAVRHIGIGRHVDDPHQPKRNRTFIDRFQKSVRKRIKRVKRRIASLHSS